MPDVGAQLDQLAKILPLIAPLVVLQIALLVLAAIDLFRDERQVRFFGKPVWALIIVFVNIVGPLAYFFVGREE